MIHVIIRGEERHTGEYYVKTEAEMWVMCLQAKGYQRSDGSLQKLGERHGTGCPSQPNWLASPFRILGFQNCERMHFWFLVLLILWYLILKAIEN